MRDREGVNSDRFHHRRALVGATQNGQHPARAARDLAAAILD
jgi:hypothetical protein